MTRPVRARRARRLHGDDRRPGARAPTPPAHTPRSEDTALEDRRTTDATTWARVVNCLIGIWLIISAFVWPHNNAEQLDTWILGIWIAAFSLMALRQPAARWLNTLAAIWLFFSTLAIHRTQPATTWNNVIAAIVVFALSLVGVTGSRPHGTRGPARA